MTCTSALCDSLNDVTFFVTRWLSIDERNVKRMMEMTTSPATTHKATIRIFFQGKFLKSMFVNLARKAIIKLNNWERLIRLFFMSLLLVKSFHVFEKGLRV